MEKVWQTRGADKKQKEGIERTVRLTFTMGIDVRRCQQCEAVLIEMQTQMTYADQQKLEAQALEAKILKAVEDVKTSAVAADVEADLHLKSSDVHDEHVRRPHRSAPNLNAMKVLDKAVMSEAENRKERD